MLIAYFGKWPEWIDLFIETCKWNPDVHWRLFTDCGLPRNTSENVEVVHTTFAEYSSLISERLGIKFAPARPYKLCDIKPCLGYIHENEIGDYEFFGFGDIDVVYGEIRKFYTEALRKKYDVISTHDDRVSGHFAVMRNTADLRNAFRKLKNYEAILEQPEYGCLDETPFGALFKPRSSLGAIIDGIGRRPRALFFERYSTILSGRGWHDGTLNYPQRWFWKRGQLTNENDGERQFLYLHFMRWKSTLYESTSRAVGQGAWLKHHRLVHIDWPKARDSGFCISPEGFTEC